MCEVLRDCMQVTVSDFSVKIRVLRNAKGGRRGECEGECEVVRVRVTVRVREAGRSSAGSG